jgi:hypothetical protein
MGLPRDVFPPSGPLPGGPTRTRTLPWFDGAPRAIPRLFCQKYRPSGQSRQAFRPEMTATPNSSLGSLRSRSSAKQYRCTHAWLEIVSRPGCRGHCTTSGCTSSVLGVWDKRFMACHPPDGTCPEFLRYLIGHSQDFQGLSGTLQVGKVVGNETESKIRPLNLVLGVRRS